MSVKQLLQTIIRKKNCLKTKQPKPKRELTLIPYQPKSTETMFSSKYQLTATGCWEWCGKLDRYGYGSLTVHGKLYKAHRYSYEQYYGAFDSSLHVLHHCDNPKCVNPQHLFLGTNRDNIEDKVNKGRSKIQYKRLTENETKAILSQLPHKHKKELATEFGVHISTILRIQAKYGSCNI